MKRQKKWHSHYVQRCTHYGHEAVVEDFLLTETKCIWPANAEKYIPSPLLYVRVTMKNVVEDDFHEAIARSFFLASRDLSFFIPRREEKALFAREYCVLGFFLLYPRRR